MIRAAAAAALLAALSIAAAAAAGEPGAWTRIHAGNAPGAEAGLARTANGNLHLVWQRPGVGGDELVHQAISPAGALLGSAVVVARGWRQINPHVELVAAGNELRALWAGVKEPGDPLSGPIVTATSANGGTTWSAASAFTTTSGAWDASGIAAVISASGVVAAAQGDSPAGANAVRLGVPGAPDVRYESACCAAAPELAVDGMTGDVVLAWFSSAAGGSGLWTQGLSTAGLVGARAHVPGSSTDNRAAARAPGQRTALSGRLGAAGVFLAYGAGYPAFTSVNLMRLGRSPMVVVRGSNIGHVGIAAAPEGRLWVFWSHGDRYLAARSNRAATRFGSATRIPAPARGAETSALHGDASAGLLDLVAHAGDGVSVPDWHTQVRPRLSFRVAATTLARPGAAGRRLFRRLVMRVTDAGDPVVGARVTVGGNAATTDAAGRAVLVTRLRDRIVAARATKVGYTAASTRVRV